MEIKVQVPIHGYPIIGVYNKNGDLIQDLTRDCSFSEKKSAGQAIAMSSDKRYIAIGSPQDLNDQGYPAGDVYLFRLTASGHVKYELLYRLKNVVTEPPAADDQFGKTLAFSQDKKSTRLAVGTAGGTRHFSIWFNTINEVTSRGGKE